MTTISAEGEDPAPARVASAALFVVLTAGERLAHVVSRRLMLDPIAGIEIGRGQEHGYERTGGPARLVVPDSRMSAPHARLRRERDRWLIEDLGSKNGVLVDGERVARATLSDGDVIEVGHTFLVFREPAALGPDRPGDAEVAAGAGPLTALHPVLQTAFARLVRVATSPLPVVIGGETGTGKERIARAIHEQSGRPGPLIAVNCGALPRSLLESELFGYRKGAFSGALHDKLGLIAASDQGTLFLDEVAELPLDAQAALLRVLEERAVLPVGATRPQPVDLRTVAATHRDLAAEVAAGRFRADLRARLDGFTITLPPLRDRREDLAVAAAEILVRFAPERPGLSLTLRAARTLFAWGWPGNFRELARALELAATMSDGDALVIAPRAEDAPAPRTASAAPPPALRPPEARRREELIARLREHGGNVTEVARATGKAREQIYRWLKAYQIDPAEYRG
ncbi:MAG TPA: sigma 54-interacting transcriptional regulator [Kofleriaceae bacterium]|nr:sigma 54-interacting transcriptional regulator [Kofleriaceae bacterium]